MSSSQRPDLILKEFLENKNKLKEFLSKTTDSNFPGLLEKASGTYGLQENLPFKEQDLETGAMAGNPVCLAMLGKRYYDNPAQRHRAWVYFDAATQAGSADLAHAVGRYVKEPRERRKYLRRAIEKGSQTAFYHLLANENFSITNYSYISTYYDKNQNNTNPDYYHAVIAAMSHSNKDKLFTDYYSDTFTTYVDKQGYLRRKKSLSGEDFYEQFKKFARVNPAEFKALCIECSKEEIENVLGKSSTNRYFETFQRELADEILAQEANGTTREAAKKELQDKYHEDYFKNIDVIINSREFEIEKKADIIFKKLQESTLDNTRALLSEMKKHLRMEEKPGHKGNELAQEERDFLKEILSTDPGKEYPRPPEPVTNKMESKDFFMHLQASNSNKYPQLHGLIKNNPKVQSIFLQLQAFDSIDTYLAKTTAKSNSSNVTKLQDATVIIDEANVTLLKRGENLPTRWEKFCRFVSDLLKSIGLPPLKEAPDIKKMSGKQRSLWSPAKQAVTKAKKSLAKALEEKDRIHEEIPTIKRTHGKK